MERRVRPMSSATLPEWLEKWFAICDTVPQPHKPDPVLNASRFGLTGIDRTDESITCISTTDAKISSIDAGEPFIRRDYDSIIGYSATYPLSRQVSFFPHAPHFKTLRKAVHVKHRFYVRSPVSTHEPYLLLTHPDQSQITQPTNQSTWASPTPVLDLNITNAHVLLGNAPSRDTLSPS